MADMAAAARGLHALGFRTLGIAPGSKEPAFVRGAQEHGVKDATADDAATDAYYAANTAHGIGVCGEGFVILDLDCHGEVDGRETLLEWQRENGKLPDTLAETTPSGGEHWVYRAHGEVRPSTNGELGVDVRAWGSYIVCDPTPGYRWDRDLEPGCIAEADERVMAFVRFVGRRRERRASTAADSSAKRRVKQGGRNDFLYRDIGCAMRSDVRYTDAFIAETIRRYNDESCVPPLPALEVDKIVESVLALPRGHSEEVREQEARRSIGRPRKFEHNKVARQLIDEQGACMLDGMPAIRPGGREYQVGWDAIDAAVIDMNDDCTEANRREVKAYIKAKAPAVEQSSPDLVAFANGVLDVRTGAFRGWQEDDAIPNVIPHDWNPCVGGGLLDKTLEKMACGNLEVLMNLHEFMGLCMTRSSRRYPFFPVLIGNGANGKSTYIALLKALVGPANISSLQPKDISARFMGSHIVGKTANLGDDIPSGYLDGRDCSVIKSVATGDLMFTDVKGGRGFEFEPYCTMVFSCNQFPRLADTTPGFMRRLYPVEFNAVFSRDDADYDPLIAEKLMGEDVMERACVLAIEGLRRVIAQNGPTPNPLSESMKREIAREGNTAMQWMFDDGVTAESVIGRTKEEVYSDYMAWAERNGCARTAMAAGTLAAQIGTYMRLSCQKMGHRDVGGVRKTVRVFDYKNR